MIPVKISDIIEGISLFDKQKGKDELLNYLSGGNTYMIVTDHFTEKQFRNFVDFIIVTSPRHYNSFYIHDMPKDCESFYQRYVIIMSQRFGIGQFEFEVVNYGKFYNMVMILKEIDKPAYEKFKISIVKAQHISTLKFTSKGFEVMKLPEVWRI